MLSTKVAVRISTAEYQVQIGRDLLGKVGRIVAPLSQGSRAVVVTDAQVGPLYAGAVMESLIEVGFETSAITVPAGETSKSWELAGQVVDQLAKAGLERIDLVVAVGGGVVGDLAGFCAGVFLRGIPFFQVPTTLLAQVDSSVGGKTGVDLAAGKNLAGVFKQPLAVIADIACLQTLPDDEWRSGLAEIAKSAVLDSEEFLAWLEDNAKAMLARDDQAVAEAVRRSVTFKARVVASDELEAGPREALNLGHTLGHAIEKVAGYGVYSHGAAVAQGMRFAARLAQRVAGVSEEFVYRQAKLLDALGLDPILGEFDPDELRLAMSSDKKSRGGTPRFVLATAPGHFTVSPVDEAIVAEELRAWTRDRG